MKAASAARESRHLSVLPTKELTRAQVAARLDVSISTVRRYEGERLHPRVDEVDVRWFDEKEVAALAATLTNEPRVLRRRNAEAGPGTRAAQRTPGEIAAQVFERLEQRQSLAEIVIGVRVEPSVVRDLYEQWCLGLVGGQLALDREPRMPRDSEVPRASREELAALLAELPAGEVTRISVARYRGAYHHGDYTYPEVVELGGFVVSGPCDLGAITHRHGRGDYRITAYRFDPPALSWEVVIEGLV